MRTHTSLTSVLFFAALAARADLILQQQTSDTHGTNVATISIHGHQMRMDNPAAYLSVIVDLNTRDSTTLITSNKTCLQRFGSEVRWEMQEEQKYTHGTNEVDFPPAPAVATGKSETVNGLDTKIFTWSGAYGLKETLWVASASAVSNYDAIQLELAKLDKFNTTGQHRNVQPELSRLPGMVVKSQTDFRGHQTTTTLVSVKVEPVDDSLFKLPDDYVPWKRPEQKPSP